MTPGEPLCTVLQLPGGFISLGSMLCTSRAACDPALELICSVALDDCASFCPALRIPGILCSSY